METRLNFFLFLAFIFILGLNYKIKRDNEVVEPKKKTDFIEKKNTMQTDSTVIASKTNNINYFDATKVGNITNQK
ncbi:MAG: hypothetical protein HC831_24640 [Chloroflexia bacterium]|nr:hypothetical protein [Chloroflexia bacterium]